MFEQSLIESGVRTRKSSVKWFFLLTAFVYTLAFSGIVVVGILMAHPTFAEAFIEATLIAPPPPPPPPPPAASAPAAPTKALKAIVVPAGFVAPTVVPKRLPPTLEEVSDVMVVGGVPGGVMGGVPGGVMGGVPGGVIGSVLSPTATPPPPPAQPKLEAPPPPPTTPRRVSTGVLQGKSIRRITPQYPPAARAARIEGSVDVNVVIDESGNVIEAEAISGHPLFRQAARLAALQWKFRPTLLNGIPIKVEGVLTFVFHYGG